MRLMARLLLVSDGMGFFERYYAIPSPKAKFEKVKKNEKRYVTFIDATLTSTSMGSQSAGRAIWRLDRS
jgi:hypothetical protein